MFYTGKGVFRFEGVEYEQGDELPEGVPAETLDKLKARGAVSDSPVQRQTAGSLDARVAQLQAQLTEATDAASHNSDEISRLQGVAEGLTAQLTEAQSTISALTAQLTAPGGAPEQPAGAGPKK